MLTKSAIILLILCPLVWSVSRKQLVDFAVKQYTKAVQTLKTGSEYPCDASPLSPTWTTHSNGWFQSGMYPGILWKLYNYTGDSTWMHLAMKATDGLAHSQNITTTHDIGFIIDNSYGIGYDLTKNSSYSPIIINSAKHLVTRYSSKVGCIRSWDSSVKEKGQFKVIVDNMMNLELLFRAHQLSGNKTYYNMAVSHANRTIENHLRKDYSSYHLVLFNETTGAVIKKVTAQGYSDNSTWARGQAWLVHGFAVTYGYTKMAHHLKAAQNIADYYVDNLPEDGIAPWDFNVPKDKYKYIPRDSSSAAIASTGLFKLYSYTNNSKYLLAAKKIMESLSSPKYRADGKPEYKIPALIVNGTVGPAQGHGHPGVYGKYDQALSYGDYYFVESFKYLD